MKREQPTITVIARRPTLVGDLNRAQTNYRRYAMSSREVFLNLPTANRANVRKVPIMWTDNDEEDILYFHEDALVIKANIASKDFQRILVDIESSMDIFFKLTLDEMRIMDLKLECTNTSLIVGMREHFPEMIRRRMIDSNGDC